MLNKIKKIIHKVDCWLNKYAFEYRIFVLVAVIYLLYAHYTGC
jgi:hypothetical protein